jgi:hypothetical protein
MPSSEKIARKAFYLNKKEYCGSSILKREGGGF